MSTYLISYDLVAPGRNYDDLYEAIKGIGTWWHCLESVWIVKTNLSAVQIRDRLEPYLDSNDKLLVAQLTGVAAWYNFSEECSKWLNNNL